MDEKKPLRILKRKKTPPPWIRDLLEKFGSPTVRPWGEGYSVRKKTYLGQCCYEITTGPESGIITSLCSFGGMDLRQKTCDRKTGGQLGS